MRAGLLCCVLADLALPLPVRADEVPSPAPVGAFAQVPVDGWKYCQQLAARVDKAADQRPEKRAETAELIRGGKAQCALGHIKSGLHRLRIALEELTGE